MNIKNKSSFLEQKWLETDLVKNGVKEMSVTIEKNDEILDHCTASPRSTECGDSPTEELLQVVLTNSKIIRLPELLYFGVRVDTFVPAQI